MSGVLYRMIPDANKGGSPVTIGGKKIVQPVNTFIDMPYEAAVTTAGWVNAGLVGTTAQRPQNAKAGEHFIDTTLSKVLVADQYGNWHDPFTGGIV